ncbi:MAG: hypothetical protein IPK26_28225 [Planctomycetes bacterium]|nr:hypothetical protein [Planctomycetota bacterium]
MTPSPTPAAVSRDNVWQQRLRPFMMAMVVGLSLVFLTASIWLLVDVRRTTEYREPERRIELSVESPAATHMDALELASRRADLALEQLAIEQRYRQSHAALQSRICRNFLGFLTGMTMSLVGAVFVLGKLQTLAPTDLAVDGGKFGVTLRSASPGLVLAALGAALMVTTIFVNHPIETYDVPVYWRDSAMRREAARGAPVLEMPK